MVTFENDYLAGCYVSDTALKWPVLVDDTREVYNRYGMLTASFWDIWGLKTWVSYLRELSKGTRLKKSEGDIYQRGGDVLIDPDGMVRVHHVGEGPADRPAVASLLSVISHRSPGSHT